MFVLATNALNHPNWADPNTSLSAGASFGRISGVRFDGNASGIGPRLVQVGARVEF